MLPRLANNSAARGLTVVEVLIAMLILSVGLLGLTASTAVTTRMIGQARRFNEVSAFAGRRLEALRSRHCSTLNAGSETEGRFVVRWQVQDVAAGRAYDVRLVVESPTPRGMRADTFSTTILC